MSNRQRALKLLQRLQRLLRQSSGLLACLDPGEAQQHARSLINTVLPIITPRLADLPAEVQSQLQTIIDTQRENPQLLDALAKEVQKIANDLQQKYKSHRDAKPRNQERDAEIVRLRDQEGCTFGRIPHRLKTSNPAWVNKDGSTLSRDAVEKAYKRYKALPADK
jgi:hypothetical protein